jgi:hypothetical protein
MRLRSGQVEGFGEELNRKQMFFAYRRLGGGDCAEVASLDGGLRGI